jgi:acyl-coenzyme A synthetase/AMP-(fatty) acid ligase
MQGNRQFDDTEACSEVTAINRNIIDDELPKLFAKLNQLHGIQRLHIGGTVNLGEQFSWFYQHERSGTKVKQIYGKGECFGCGMARIRILAGRLGLWA